MDASTAGMAIDGELTVFTVEAWKARLSQALGEHGTLAVDLAAVTEFDSAGLQLLAALKREGDAQGRTVVLCNPAPAVADVLALYRLQAPFGIGQQ
jgi:anti-sigma B factor antagonist